MSLEDAYGRVDSARRRLDAVDRRKISPPPPEPVDDEDDLVAELARIIARDVRHQPPLSTTEQQSVLVGEPSGPLDESEQLIVETTVARPPETEVPNPSNEPSTPSLSSDMLPDPDGHTHY